MGCVSSKLSSKPLQWCSRRSSPTYDMPDDEDDNEDRHVVSLISTSYGLLSIETSPSHGSFLHLHKPYLCGDNKALVTASDNPTIVKNHLSLGIETTNEKQFLLDDAAQGSYQCMETINTWELMEGLEEYCRTPSPARFNGCPKPRRAQKPASFHSLDVSEGGDAGPPVWKKYYMPADLLKQNASSILPTGSPFAVSPRKTSPSASSFLDSEGSRSSSSSGEHGNAGLKVLLSPGYSPSRFRRNAPKKGGFHSTSFSFDGNTEQLRKFLGNFRRSPFRSPDLRKKRSKSTSRRSSQDIQKDPEGSLFDPSLIATFEKALDAAMTINNQDDWIQATSTEGSTANSSASGNIWTSSETASDAESRPEWFKKDKPTIAQILHEGMDEPLISVPSLIGRNEAKINSKKAQLSSYDWKCPPRGEGKVVLYFTSLRGVRRTYEECCTLRLILRGLGVHVDERDISMHSKFKEELMDILGNILTGPPYVPQLFIKGRYIGGADAVKHLHEEGVLARLVDGLAVNTPLDVCDVCGDVRFIPCDTCNGSCKTYNTNGNGVQRCRLCNENGLIMCPMCTK